MTKEIRSPKSKGRRKHGAQRSFRTWSLAILSSFGFRHSSLFLLPLCCLAPSSGPFSATDKGPTARVVIMHDPDATEAFHADPLRVRTMVTRGLTNLTQRGTIAAAWRSLVSTQDFIGLKVYAGPGPTSGTRPAVVTAVIETLLEAGIASNHIVLWDKSIADLKTSGFFELGAQYGVAVEASAAAGYDLKTFYETPLLGTLLPGDVEFGRRNASGRKSYVSKLVTTRMTKIVNITPLLNHNTAGVCGNLYSLAIGSVDNTFRFEPDYSRLATAVPEIYALPALGDRVVLNIVDALICQYQGEQTMLLHYSTALNELRFSKDPVALDVLSLHELERQRKAAGMLVRTNSLELFQNAALLELGVSDVANIRIETPK